MGKALSVPDMEYGRPDPVGEFQVPTLAGSPS
jgi:hypothetical protein